MGQMRAPTVILINTLVSIIVAVSVTLVAHVVILRTSPSHHFADITVNPTVYIESWTSSNNSNCDGSGADQDIHKYTQITVESTTKIATITLSGGIGGADNPYCVFTQNAPDSGAKLPYDANGYIVTIPGHGSLLVSPENAVAFLVVTVDKSGHMNLGGH
jgi:hypothetical protein